VHRIIIDTDLAMGAAGSDIDDGFALALAVDLLDQKLELLTTVNGNVDVDTSTLLTLDLLDRLGRPDIPVVKGAAAPLQRPVHEHPARDRVAGVRERLAARTPAPGRCVRARLDRLPPGCVPGQGILRRADARPAGGRGGEPATAGDPAAGPRRGGGLQRHHPGRDGRGPARHQDPPQSNCLAATEVDSAAFIDFFLNHVYSV
jgi:hypothetical protein